LLGILTSQNFWSMVSIETLSSRHLKDKQYDFHVMTFVRCLLTCQYANSIRLGSKIPVVMGKGVKRDIPSSSETKILHHKPQQPLSM